MAQRRRPRTPSTDPPPQRTESAVAVADEAEDKRVDIQRALKLRLVHRLSYQAIANEFGVSRQSIHQKLRRFSALIEDPDSTAAFRGTKADLLDAAQLALVSDLIDTERRQKASLNNTAYALRQIYDMGRLERGQATGIIDYSSVSENAADLERRLAELEAEERKLSKGSDGVYGVQPTP